MFISLSSMYFEALQRQLTNFYSLFRHIFQLGRLFHLWINCLGNQIVLHPSTSPDEISFIGFHSLPHNTITVVNVLPIPNKFLRFLRGTFKSKCLRGHIWWFCQIQSLDREHLSQFLRCLPKKSIFTTFACFGSQARISSSQMCPLKSYVPPDMSAVSVRLYDRVRLCRACLSLLTNDKLE